MKEQPTQREELEERGEISERRETRGRREAPRRRRERQSSQARIDLPLILSALALIVSVAALFFALRPERAEEPPASSSSTGEPVTFRFGDRTLTALEGMPLNPYDRSAFTVDGRGRLTYEKDGKRAKTGVDVSIYQGEVDWPAVAADGIDFAILRVGYRGYTEGGLFPDQTFALNLQGALDAGLEVGVYFFSQAITPEEAEEEAEYILEALGGEKITYPVAFDWEPITPGENARTDGLDGAALTRCAAAFCKRVEKAGLRPAVYFNQTQAYLHYDLRELADFDLWLAEYGVRPDFYYRFDLWQYTHTGTAAGIEGDVDLNLDLRGME